MLKIGHRGAKGHVAENTLASFQKAIELGVDAIELDVHCCATGEIMVIHDDTIDRTTTGTGLVSKLSLSQLKNVSIDVVHFIPTLEEVLDFISGRCIVNIELKGENTAEKTMQILDTYINEKNWKHEQFLVSSFDWLALEQVHKHNQFMPIGVLTLTDIELAIGFAKFCKAKAIHPYFHLLTAEHVAQMKAENLNIYPWTVNLPEDIALVQSLNVDGIISDYPERL
jgi:glycerophosphoryl diester phosphodiesterase